MLELRVSPKTAAVWKRHLRSPDGDLGVQALRLQLPVPRTPPDGVAGDRLAFQAGKVAGYEECLRNLLGLQERQDPETEVDFSIDPTEE